MYLSRKSTTLVTAGIVSLKTLACSVLFLLGTFSTLATGTFWMQYVGLLYTIPHPYTVLITQSHHWSSEQHLFIDPDTLWFYFHVGSTQTRFLCYWHRRIRLTDSLWYKWAISSDTFNGTCSGTSTIAVWGPTLTLSSWHWLIANHLGVQSVNLLK